MFHNFLVENWVFQIITDLTFSPAGGCKLPGFNLQGLSFLLCVSTDASASFLFLFLAWLPRDHPSDFTGFGQRSYLSLSGWNLCLGG